MEKEKIRVWGRIKMIGLKNKGLIETSQDLKTTNYVLFMSQGIQKKWLNFNFPEEMWRIRCSQEEVLPFIEDFLNEKILAS